MKWSWVGLALLMLGCVSPTRQATTACTGCKGSVVVFLGVDCPISQKYVARLNAIHKRTADQFRWTAFVPQQITSRTLSLFKTEYSVEFPLRIDDRKQAAKKFGAGVTPEVFVFDNKGDIQYAGAIDNWFYDLGKYRPQPTEHYLDSALAAVAHQRKPEVTKTEAVGCFIQYKK